MFILWTTESNCKIGTFSIISLFLINTPEANCFVNMSDFSRSISERISLNSNWFGTNASFSVRFSSFPISISCRWIISVDPRGPFVTLEFFLVFKGVFKHIFKYTNFFVRSIVLRL